MISKMYFNYFTSIANFLKISASIRVGLIFLNFICNKLVSKISCSAQYVKMFELAPVIFSRFIICVIEFLLFFYIIFILSWILKCQQITSPLKICILHKLAHKQITSPLRICILHKLAYKQITSPLTICILHKLALKQMF